LIFFCKKETTPPEETEPTIIATGILDGETWNGYLNHQNLSDDYLSFGLKQKKEEIGCPHHEISFRFFPLNEGTYLLKSDANPQPQDSSVSTQLYYTCGDALLAVYDIEETDNTFATITSASDNSLTGIFSAKFILTDSFPDVPQFFEFEDVEFEVEF